MLVRTRPRPRLQDEWLGEVDRRSVAYGRWVQESLNRLQNAGLTVDGIMGPLTRNAVRAFQGRQGLVQDGVVGPLTERAMVAAGASPPPGAAPGPGPTPPGPQPAGVPALLSRAADPPALTLYVALPLGGESPARVMTGIFLPQGYRRQSDVDVILYLHGHKTARPELAIDGYWDRRLNPQWALREELNAAARNAVLVAPTLGPRSQAGRLVSPGGLDAYMDAVLAALRVYGPDAGGQTPTLRSLILACHSGGGYPMRQLALSKQRTSALIRECWGFDCLYNTGDENYWAQWARSRPDARLFIYYIGTADKSLALRRMGLSNVTVERSTRGHDWVPINHWRERIQSAPFLQTTS